MLGNISCCTQETNVANIRVGFPVKDSQGNAIEQNEGVDLLIQYPGTTNFVNVGTCVYPNDLISWDLSKVPDGNYIAVAVGYFFKVRGKGCAGGSCKRYGPPSAPIAIEVREARPGTPPAPVELDNGGSCCAPTISLV